MWYTALKIERSFKQLDASFCAFMLVWRFRVLQKKWVKCCMPCLHIFLQCLLSSYSMKYKKQFIVYIYIFRLDDVIHYNLCIIWIFSLGFDDTLKIYNFFFISQPNSISFLLWPITSESRRLVHWFLRSGKSLTDSKGFSSNLYRHKQCRYSILLELCYPSKFIFAGRAKCPICLPSSTPWRI